MPKGKKKGKYEHKRTEQAYSSDEDAGIDMTIDNMSETSGQSDLKSIHDEADAEIQEKFEEKVMETIDGLGARANAARAAALVSLRAALQRRYLAPLLANHRATLADHLTKAIRRGRDGERKAAAALAPLLSLQIGEEGTEEFVKEVRPALAACAVDKTASIETRTECCLSLSVLCYLLEEDLSEILDVMRMYETIFSGSYLKGDGSVKVTGLAVEAGALHAAALDGWALLLSLPPAEHAAALLRSAPPGLPRLADLLAAASLEGDGSVKVTGLAVEAGALHAAALDGWALLLSLPPAEHAAALLRSAPPGLPRLADLLAAASLEVRMAAGGALAIAFECIAETDAGDEAAEYVEGLLPRLDELARDSHKFRAKKERKLQRATFRDILKYFEEDIVPSLRVRVGTESVECGTWWARAAYGALAATLGAGLQALAPHSTALRGALRLPDVVATHAPKQKLNKLHRHLANNAADKARTVARGKNRDKRSAALAV